MAEIKVYIIKILNRTNGTTPLSILDQPIQPATTKECLLHKLDAIMNIFWQTIFIKVL